MRCTPWLAALSLTFWLAPLIAAQGLPVPAPAPTAAGKKYEDFDKVVAGAKQFEGLFKLHQKDEHLYAEIRTDQFERPYLAPIAVARGAGLGGHTLNFDAQWVIMFKRVGDRVHLVRRNVRFRAASGPVKNAVETTYTDSILMSMRIRAINSIRNTVVIDLSDIFLTNFADLDLGHLDPNRTVWHKVKAFPRNLELQVAATFTGSGENQSVIDPRGNTVIIHYSLVELPEIGYQPRVADDRIGYFLTVMKDYGLDQPENAYVRYINRWRLERVDGSVWKEGAKLVPPKKKIVFWIEKSVPDEYRSAVREGILEWNKAFEKIGFKDAIEVRQQESEDFDPEDVNYNTFRWITSDAGYAMGASRANPFTGEIIDADIIFDASMVRYYKNDQHIYRNAKGELIDPPSWIQASHQGWTMQPALQPHGGWNNRARSEREGRAPLNPLLAFQNGFCQCGAHKQQQLGLGMIHLAVLLNQKPGEKLPDELVQQAVKETAMHEVGHTLGLRHNFKASTMLKNEQLHDVTITRQKGLVASVMDYNPINLAAKGAKQGDFFTPTLGPYDYWAIEYGYKPISGKEGDELKKIAARSAEPGHDYGTDEDLRTTSDPLINQWDLGADPMKFAQERMILAEQLLKGLADRVVEPGEGYQRARTAFNILLRQYGDGAFLTARFVGGEYLHRDHRGDPNARDPFVPVTPARQREALAFLQKHILTDQPFSFPPELLRKLGADRWMHWGNDSTWSRSVDFPIYERVLSIQRVVLGELLDTTTLHRIQNVRLKTEGKDPPLTLADLFRSLTDSIYADLGEAPKGGASPKSTVIRRNLQRAYIHDLGLLVLGSSAPADAKSLARMHLRNLSRRMEKALDQPALEDTVRAHFEDSREQIAKILNASLQTTQP